MKSLAIADVVVEARAAGADALYSYRNDAGAWPGACHLVPLGPRQVLGYVVGTRSVAPSDLGFAPGALRPLGSRVEGLDLPPATLELVRDVAKEYLCSLSVAITPATPPGLRQRLATTWTLGDEPLPDDLPAIQREVVEVLLERGGRLIEAPGAPLSAGVRKALALLKAKGCVHQMVTVAPLAERRRLDGAYRLTPDAGRVEAFLAKDGRRRPMQALTVLRLQGAEGAGLSAPEIKALSGATDQTLRGLLQSGLLVPVEREAAPHRATVRLNQAQQAAFDAISGAVCDRRYEPFLLHGVTGSGKTEVYLHAAREALALGRQVLFLVPEIALTAQAISQLRSRFGERVAVLHSALPPVERLQAWAAIRSGERPVVLGTRSALFAPCENLGLIVIDEEHDGSYKQESAPRYLVRPLAERLAARSGAALVFGSATPSLETYHASRTGRLRLLELRERAATDAKLPLVHVVDLKQPSTDGKRSLFSLPLRKRLHQMVGRGEQAILFLNRRSFAPFLLCRSCGYAWPCPNCAVTLSYHKKAGVVRCHHCDYTRPAPDVCPQCLDSRIRTVGAGAEKVEEAVVEELPGVAVARLDRDVARVKGKVEETLARFGSGQLQVLVGTQMVAKGLDFPNVTLVGVIAADVTLNLPDFRASERSYQLLSQVAGRAGRGARPGEVVIQTFNPDHVSVRCATTHDYAALVEALMTEREEVGYPPFVRLVNILFQGEDRAAVVRASGAAKDRLVTELRAHALRPEEQSHTVSRSLPVVLGPTDCTVERVRGAWRRHLLVKLAIDMAPNRVLEALGPEPEGVQRIIDVDPYTLD